MTFRDDDDVYGLERARVVESENVVGLDHSVDRGPPADRLLAVEILRHQTCPAFTSSRLRARVARYSLASL